MTDDTANSILRGMKVYVVEVEEHGTDDYWLRFEAVFSTLEAAQASHPEVTKWRTDKRSPGEWYSDHVNITESELHA